MKTAISIPDDLFADADRLAHRMKKSRSELYSHAVREYLARHAPDEVTDTLDTLCGEEPPDSGFSSEAARRVLEDVEW